MRPVGPEMHGRRAPRRRRKHSVAPGGTGAANEVRRRASLRTAIDDTLAGRGRLVLVECDPRRATRMLDEVQTHAEGRLARVLRARCAPGAGQMDPWGKVTAALAAPDAMDAERSAPRARFERFEEIARLLEETARSRPLVLLLDGLHEAGRSALLVLERLVRSLSDWPLVVIGTYDDVAESPDHPLAETLAELAHEPACQWLASANPGARPPEGSAHGVFRLAGDYWTIVFERQVVRLRDTKGLRYLAALLQRPGERVHVTELQSAAAGSGPAERPEIDGESRVERARIAVTKALKAALDRIAAAHPSLGQHLVPTVRRGYFCAYVPDPRRPIVWRG